ncbi:HNH endonuclease [uncultured Thiothrix sp.]
MAIINSTTNLTVDHVIPLSHDGIDDQKNLQFLCRSHNSIKGAD